jgi:choice-of-anchor B domain-containing protein
MSHRSRVRPTFVVIAFLAAAAGFMVPGNAHEGDPKVLDLVPPYPGPGFRSGEPRVLRGGELSAAAVTFPSNGVQLLSWMPLDQIKGGKNGNSCTGYVSPSGREYALIGAHSGTAFVEVTDPGDPLLVAHIPGPPSLWRDVRTYQSYAYMISEGGDGIQIVDLGAIDSGVVTHVGNQLSGGDTSTHTLFINAATGYLYRSGGAGNGLRIYSLANPANPVLVGTWNDRYTHEVTVVKYTSGPYAGKEIAFSCGGFNNGFSQTGVSILDVTNKQSIQVIKHFSYPGAAYCHQAWPSADLKYLYIDDELDETGTNFTNTKVIDITNLSNPVVKTPFVNQSTAIGHNLYVEGQRIYEANYRSGLRVFDNTNALAPVEVAWFDTWPEDDGASYSGLWNNYPYLPSGIVLGSDINRGLFVWWVGAPLVDIAFPGGIPDVVDPAGQTIAVQIQEASAGTLVPGSGRIHYDVGAGWISQPLAHLGGTSFQASLPAMACGKFVDWYVTARSSNGITWTAPAGAPLFAAQSTSALAQTLVHADDMEAPSGWTVGAFDDDATNGKWVLGNPVLSAAQPEDDRTPGSGVNCWFTRQPPSGGATPGSHDVDGGKTTLTSPALDVSGLSNGFVSYWRWYSNNIAAPADDTFLVQASASPAGPWVTVENVGPTGPGTSVGWFRHQFRASDFVAGNTLHLRFVASDNGVDNLVEAAVDELEVFDLDCPTAGPQVYCTAKINSQGCTPSVAWVGTPSVGSGLPFTISASQVLNLQNGLLFYSFGSASVPFQGGTLCLAAPTTRTAGQNSGGNPPPDDCSGNYSFDFNAYIAAGNDPALVAGAKVYAQYWGRDPLDPAGFGSTLTDALEFTLEP